MKSLYSLSSLCIVILSWYLIALSGAVSRVLLPYPHEVIAAFFLLFATGNIIPDLAGTLFRVFFGASIAILLGIPIGILMGYYKKAYQFLEPIVEFGRSVPSTALIPLFILFLGLGEAMLIAVVVFSVSFLVIINTMYGVRNVKQTRLLIAKSMGASRLQTILKIVLPESVPYIFSGIRLSISKTIIIIIVVEMLVGNSIGIGRRLLFSQYVLDVKEMYALILLAGLMGIGLNKAFEVSEKRMLHWSGK